MGWCCVCGWLGHRCVTHVSAVEELSWARCAQAKHLQVLAAETWDFKGQCCLERDALTMMFRGPIFWLQADCQVYCFPPFLLSPEQCDLWGFALLCKGLGPAFPLEITSFCGGSHPAFCGGWGTGWHMSHHVPAALAGMAHQRASKWPTLPSGRPAGSK